MIKVLHIGPSREKGWVFSPDGVMATITSTCYKEPPKILVETEHHIEMKGRNIYGKFRRN